MEIKIAMPLLPYYIILLSILLVDISLTDTIDCSKVECPAPGNIECPSDSASHLEFPPDLMKLLAADQTITDYKNNFTSDTRQRRAVAYQRHESIKIVPGGYIQKRSIPEDFESTADPSANRTTTAVVDPELLTKCCPRRVCVCLSTSCNLNCQPPSVLVEDTTSTPGKCCESFKCVQPDHCKHNNRIYSNGTQWKEQDSCIECECINGRATCSTSLCKPLSCLKKKQVTGECCPVCDYANTNFCVGDEECDKVCKHGYRRSEAGCSLCKCAREQIHVDVTTEQQTTTSTATTTISTTSPVTSVPADSEPNPAAPPTNPIISCPESRDYYYLLIGCAILSAVLLTCFFVGFALYYCRRSSRQRYRVVNSADSLNIK